MIPVNSSVQASTVKVGKPPALQMQTGTHPVLIGWERTGDPDEFLASKSAGCVVYKKIESTTTSTGSPVSSAAPMIEIDTKQIAETARQEKPCISSVKFCRAWNFKEKHQYGGPISVIIKFKPCNVQWIRDIARQLRDEGVSPYWIIEIPLEFSVWQMSEYASNVFFDFFVRQGIFAIDEATHFKTIFGYKPLSDEALTLSDQMEILMQGKRYEEAVQIAHQIHLIEEVAHFKTIFGLYKPLSDEALTLSDHMEILMQGKRYEEAVQIARQIYSIVKNREKQAHGGMAPLHSNETHVNVAFFLGKRLKEISPLHAYKAFKILIEICVPHPFVEEGKKCMQEIAFDLSEKLIKNSSNLEGERSNQLEMLQLLNDLYLNEIETKIDKKITQLALVLLEKYAGFDLLDPNNRLFKKEDNGWVVSIIQMAEKLYSQRKLLRTLTNRSVPLEENNSEIVHTETKEKEENRKIFENSAVSSGTVVLEVPTATRVEDAPEALPILPKGWKKIENSKARSMPENNGMSMVYEVQREVQKKETEDQVNLIFFRVEVQKGKFQYIDQSEHTILTEEPVINLRLYFKPYEYSKQNTYFSTDITHLYRGKEDYAQFNDYYEVELYFDVGRELCKKMIFEHLVEKKLLLKAEADYLHVLCGYKELSEKEKRFLQNMELAVTEERYQNAIQYAKEIHEDALIDIQRKEDLYEGDFAEGIDFLDDADAAFVLGCRLRHSNLPLEAIDAFKILKPSSFYYEKAKEYITGIAIEQCGTLKNEAQRRPFRIIVIQNLLYSMRHMSDLDLKTVLNFIEVYAGFAPLDPENRLFDNTKTMHDAVIRMADRIFKQTEAISELESKKASHPSTSLLSREVTVTASAAPVPTSSPLLSFSTAASLATNTKGETTTAGKIKSLEDDEVPIRLER